MMRRISVGLLETGSRPAADRTFCASGMAVILAISALSLAMRSSGVPRGANSASHDMALKFGTPASRSVGIFGMDGERQRLGHTQGDNLAAADHRQDRSRVRQRQGDL